MTQFLKRVAGRLTKNAWARKENTLKTPLQMFVLTFLWRPFSHHGSSSLMASSPQASASPAPSSRGTYINEICVKKYLISSLEKKPK